MLKIISLPLALAFSSVSYGACMPDSPEMGDIGPSSELVCDLLESQIPRTNIAIIDRKIHSPNSVSVIVLRDGQSRSLQYKLKGADWELIEATLAGSY